MEINYKIINGNSYEELKKFPDNYFDSVVTDPPYGLGKEPNAEEVLKAWVEVGYLEVSGTGFMGNSWDSFVPQPLFWKEVFRVLKHGGHVVSFFGTRTYDWGVMAMRLAGFEIRDSLQYMYGCGFPKSHNISKAIDKMYGAEREVVGESPYTNMNIKGKDGFMVNDTEKRIRQKITTPSTDQAKQWDGWGSALKPAVEPIVLARKPLDKGLNIAENVLKWGTGSINIDGCRVATDESWTNVAQDIRGNNGLLANKGNHPTLIKESNPQGRFPANLLMSHHPDCECVGTVDWNCVDDCPIKILDEQSGESKSSNTKRNRNTIGSFGMPNDNTPEYSDKGGASRFFYCAKTSKSEKNFGLEEFDESPLVLSNQSKAELNRGNLDFKPEQDLLGYHKIKMIKNNHPTVKPIKLMQYLARLVTPPNGKVLDPFNGSGTTGIACCLEGFEYTGIELSEEYCKISEARINAWSKVEKYEDYKKVNDNLKKMNDDQNNQTNLFD